MVAPQQDGHPVLREDLAEVGHHQGRYADQQVEHADQAGAGQAGRPLGGRGPVAREMEQVVALVVGQAQRPGQRAEQLR